MQPTLGYCCSNSSSGSSERNNMRETHPLWPLGTNLLRCCGTPTKEKIGKKKNLATAILMLLAPFLDLQKSIAWMTRNPRQRRAPPEKFIAGKQRGTLHMPQLSSSHQVSAFQPRQVAWANSFMSSTFPASWHAAFCQLLLPTHRLCHWTTAEAVTSGISSLTPNCGSPDCLASVDAPLGWALAETAETGDKLRGVSLPLFSAWSAM